MLTPSSANGHLLKNLLERDLKALGFRTLGLFFVAHDRGQLSFSAIPLSRKAEGRCMNMTNTDLHKKGKKLIFRRYFRDKNGKIHFPKKSRVFPMWVNEK